MLLTSMMTRNCWHIRKMCPTKIFGTLCAFLERLRLASMRLVNVSLFHRFSAILRPQEVCAFSFQLQPTVMGDCLWVTVPRICSAFAATSTFLLYFCFYFYLSALFLLLLLHFCHLEEYSAAKKINLLVNLN